MRKIVNIILQPMSALGLNPFKRNTFLGCYVRMFVAGIILIYLIFGTVLLMYHSVGDNFWPNFYMLMPYTYFSLFFGSVLLGAHVHKSSIRYVLSGINNHVFTYPDEDDFHIEYRGYLSEVQLTKVTVLVIMYIYTTYILEGFAPLLAYLLNDTLELYLYPQWVPWSKDSTRNKILTFVLQIPVGLCGLSIIYFIQIYETLVVIEFLRQHKKLKYAIETLSERSKQKLLSKMCGDDMKKRILLYKEEYDTIFRSNLILCIKHHQKILKIFKKFEIFYNIEYTLQLPLVTSSLSFILFSLVENTDPVFCWNQIALGIVVVSTLFFRCFMGEQFSEMNWQIQNALFYNLNWYNQSASNKKLISIFHFGARQSLTFKAFRLYPASYYIFSNVIRLSYSYFNLLRATT